MQMPMTIFAPELELEDDGEADGEGAGVVRGSWVGVGEGIAEGEGVALIGQLSSLRFRYPFPRIVIRNQVLTTRRRRRHLQPTITRKNVHRQINLPIAPTPTLALHRRRDDARELTGTVRAKAGKGGDGTAVAAPGRHPAHDAADGDFGAYGEVGVVGDLVDPEFGLPSVGGREEGGVEGEDGP
jgi:hypothetical protein